MRSWTLLMVCALPCAHLPARAQDPAATVVYGRIDVSAELITLNGPGGATSLNRVSSNSSHLGIRGGERLGDDLSVLFQIEGTAGVDTGSGTPAGRNTYAGLRGGAGSLRMGVMDTPFKNLVDLVKRFLGHGMEDASSVAGTGSTANGFHRRQASSLRYDSPELYGTQLAVQYGWEDRSASKTICSAGLFHNLGWLEAGAVVDQHRNFNVPGKNDLAVSVAAKLVFGNYDLGMGWNRLRYQLANGSVARDYALISQGYRVSPAGQIIAVFGASGNVHGGAPDGATVGGSDGVRLYKGPASAARHMTVGYEHVMSKRTTLYSYVTRINNDSNANFRFGTNGINVPAAAPGVSPQGLALGVVHRF